MNEGEGMKEQQCSVLRRCPRSPVKEERRRKEGREEGRKEKECKKKGTPILSLTVITLTVGVIYMTVFEYQNQVIFNMTVFDGESRCHIDTCFLYPNEDVGFGVLKASHISI